MDLETYLSNAPRVMDYSALELTDADNYEVQNLIRGGMTMANAKAAVIGQKAMQVINQRTSNPLSGINSPSGKRVAAMFDIVVNRLTRTIAAELPVPIFGNTHIESGYQGGALLTLPAGVSVVAIQCGIKQLGAFTAAPTFASINQLTIEYTDGANNDVCTVTCRQIGYPSFLAALGADSFDLSKIRYSLTDAAQTGQFNGRFDPVSKSLFGRRTEDTLTPTSFKLPSQFQNGIIDIDGSISFDKDGFLVIGMRQLAAPQEITLSAFVSVYQKNNGGGI